jgi:hypothetical protein
MGRYIQNTLTVLSLAACVATVGLWMRSYFASDELAFGSIPHERTGDPHAEGSVLLSRFGKAGARYLVGTRRGRVAVFVLNGAAGSPGYRAGPPANYVGTTVLQKLGFDLRLARHEEPVDPSGFSAPIGDVLTFPHVVLPLWALTVAFGIIPVTRWRRWRQRRRRRPGFCESCGHDLRGSPERCPECGTVPKNSI